MPERKPFQSCRGIAVLGAGKSGLAAAELARRSCEAVFVFDEGAPGKLGSTAAALKDLGVSCRFGESASRNLSGIDLAVLSPGIDPRRPVVTQFVENGIPVIGEIEFAWQHTKTPVVAITGTNGKTTTTEMTAAVLQAAGLRSVSAGNYGVAYSKIVLPDEPRYDVVSLEVSSFQMESITTFRPKVSVWLNFAPDHLDRYDSVDEYRAAKLHIFDYQTAEDWAVVQAPDLALLQGRSVQVRSFSGFGDADYSLRDGWILEKGNRVLNYGATRLRGVHNAENVMAVLAAVQPFGIGAAQVEAALRDYAAPAHRCEWVRTLRGHEFINDSKATNLHALESCLRGRTKPVVLIAGGKQKGLDFSQVSHLVARHVSHAVLIGQIREELAQVWSDKTNCHLCSSLEEAVRQAMEVAPEGQDIVFSPGTSSFDMFSGYEERGNVFKRAVNELKE